MAASTSAPGLLRVLVGETASGKTEVALALAERLGAELLSLDSMLVYRGLDIGTAKPTATDRARVAHHLIDLASPAERYDVTRYLADAERAEADVRARGRLPLYVGGTAFYLKALTHGLFAGPPVDPELRAALEARAVSEGSPALHAELAVADPEAAARIHPNDMKRVVRGLEVLAQTGRTLTDWQREWRVAEGEAPGRERTLVGLAVDRELLEQRIAARTRSMLDGGWIEEVRALAADPGFGPTAIQALGYREVLRFLEQGGEGEFDRAQLEELIRLRTRQFARRQRTWFRRFGEIHWIPGPGADRSPAEVADEAARLFAEGASQRPE